MEFKGTKEMNILGSNEIGFGIGPYRNNVKLSVWGNDEEAKANALLISKAPEMLEILKDINNDFDVWDLLPNNVQENIYTLIKQATEL